LSQQAWYSLLKKPEMNSDSIDETIIKKLTLNESKI